LQSGIQQPDQLAEPATGQHLVAAKQNERWADLELFPAQILPSQACERFTFPVRTVGLVNFEAREPKQANKFGGLVEVSLDKTGRKLCRVATHVDDDGCLKRVVRECSSPLGSTATSNGQPVASATKPVLARNEPMMCVADPVRQFNQPE
jgi:hypothetical protein